MLSPASAWRLSMLFIRQASQDVSTIGMLVRDLGHVAVVRPVAKRPAPFT